MAPTAVPVVSVAGSDMAHHLEAFDLVTRGRIDPRFQAGDPQLFGNAVDSSASKAATP